MATTLNQTAAFQKPAKDKQYTCAFEKQLMVDNLRVAVEIYGKDRLRNGFKIRKSQSSPS